jgi:hypothetical protein
MRRFLILSFSLSLARLANAQSVGGCGSLPDASSRQTIQTFGDLRVCLSATNVAESDAELPVDWALAGMSVVLETQRAGDFRRLLIDPSRILWTVNEHQKAFTNSAEVWQEAVVTLLNYKFQADAARTNAVIVRRQLDSLPARAVAASKDIKNVEKRLRDIDARILGVQEKDRDIRNTLASLERDRGAARREANAQQMRASGATDARVRQQAEAAAARAQQRLDQIERQITDYELRSAMFDPQQEISNIRDERAQLENEHKLATLRLDLAGADSRDLAKALTQLDGPQQLAALDARVETARQALVAILEGRGKAPSP